MTEGPTPRISLRSGEVVAALGVIGSLLFVGLEIRQNTAATEGATLQAISDTHTALLLEGDAEFNDLYGRVLFGGAKRADLTAAEAMQINRYYIAFLSHLENTFLQHRSGVVSSDVFDSYGWRTRLWVTPHFLENREGLLQVSGSPEFAEFFIQRTSDIVPMSELGPPPSQ